MSRPVSVASSQAMLPPPLLLKSTQFTQGVDIFATNLRLLNLDQLEDWPHITNKTFSTKDAQQNQKQRVRCTEWALYRLFEIWDPEDARNKLQPFFPPLEPLQSLNLRAALFRALNDLKKNGLLGRETILRKTMLDECKGDKLIEVLVIFSTTVLRKTERDRNNAVENSVANRLATANTVNVAQQGSLLPLTVAHSASLARISRKREEQRGRFAQFNDLLNGKYLQLHDRLEVAETSRRSPNAAADEAQVQKAMQENWSGDKKWAQTLLYGDESNAGDLPLQMPFADVWTAVSEGEQLRPEAARVGLLENLEQRVNRQVERSRNWQSFLQKISSSHDAPNANRVSQTLEARSFSFDQHQHLQFGRNKTAANAESITHLSGPVAQEYQTLLTDVKKDLLDASKTRREGGQGWSTARITANGNIASVAPHNGHDIFSPVKSAVDYQPRAAYSFAETSYDRPSLLTNRPSFPAPFKTARSMPPHSLPPPTSMLATSMLAPSMLAPSMLAPSMLAPSKPAPPKPAPLPQARTLTRPLVSEDTQEATHPPTQAITTAESALEQKLEQKADKPILRSARIPSPELSETSSEEETAAEQIIASIANASPSPVKAPRLTLTERTRMSMAPIVRLEPPETEKIDSAISMTEPELELPSESTNRRMSLAERTRQSMAAVPTHVRSRKSISKRHSLFPVNQFETPGKPRAPPPEARRDATPTDALFSEDADYESVFKTRPRVALSPVWSPDGSSLNLDEALNMNDDDPEEVWESSPLANRRLAMNSASG